MTSPSCSYNAVPPRPPNSLEEEPGQQPANTQTMTRQQEPLGQSTEQTDQAGDGNVGEKPLKPDHVSEDHWKVIGTLKRVQVSPLLPTNLVQRFMELKMRREQQSARSSRKRTNELRRASLTAGKITSHMVCIQLISTKASKGIYKTHVLLKCFHIYQ